MTDSILDTVKSALGVELTYLGFDNDIILGINTALMELNQLGVGTVDPFKISSDAEVWTDFLSDSTKFEGCKSYIVIKTRLLFDPPPTSFAIDAFNKQLLEIGWRLTVQSAPTT